MKNNLKRLLSTVCVLALVVSLLGTSALAAPMRSTGEDANTRAEDHVHTVDVPAADAPASTGRTPVRADAQTEEDVSASLSASCCSVSAPHGQTDTINMSSDTGNASEHWVLYTGATKNGVVVSNSTSKSDWSSTGPVTLGSKTSVSSYKAMKVTYTGVGDVTVKTSAYSFTIHVVDKVGAACEHSYTAVDTTPATCTTNGLKTLTCSKCGDVQTETVLAKGHDFANGSLVSSTASTCTVAGSKVTKCANCAETQEEKLPLAAHTDANGDGKCDVCGNCDHTYTEKVTKAATCTENGEMTYTCSKCGDVYTDVIDATGHNWKADGTCANGCGEVKNTDFIAAEGWLESAYAMWPIAAGVTHYDAYVAPVGGSYTKLDSELVREYKGYMRADAMGLKAGQYTIKVVDNKGGEMVTGTLAVMAHDRSGYAFNAGHVPGAYNADGTLKANARVIYVTEQTKDTVKLGVDMGGKGVETECVGLSAIITGYKKMKDTRPLAVRIVGEVSAPANLTSGALYVDSCQNGLTIEGVGVDTTLNGWGVLIKKGLDVEVRNVGFLNSAGGDGDCLGIEQGNDYIWVHNCDFFYAAPGGDADQAKGDGSLDIKKTHYATLSYNHFWDCGKTSLLGMADDLDYITYHHNWFDHSDSRHPRVRYAKHVHVYNNYYDGVSKYGAGSTTGSNLFVEANYFRNTKYPILTSMQGNDIASGKGTFSSEDGGVIKAYGNVMVGAKNFTSYEQDNVEFDAYVAKTRDEQVPSTVKAKQGGGTYNNFDTASDFYSYPVESAADSVVSTTKYSGRVGGGDFMWEFDDATEDENYDVISALKSALLSYKTTMVSYGGDVKNSVAVAHTHTPGTWLTTKVPGCDPATQKVVNGTETQFCVECGEVLATRTVDGAHSNDGQAKCTVCGLEVSNGGGAVVSANTKILKASDFSSGASGDPITDAQLDEKYGTKDESGNLIAGSYFKTVGNVTRKASSSTKNVIDYIYLNKTGGNGIQFTVTNGPAKVNLKASSTSKSGKTSNYEIKNAAGTVVQSGAVTGNVGNGETSVSFELPAGTYTLASKAGETNDLRLIELAVTEAEATCTHEGTPVHHAAVPATCTKAGNIEYWTCAGECGKNFSDEAMTQAVADVTIEELGHDMSKTVSAAVPATCTEDGKKAVIGCSRCDVTEGGEVIEATGHTEAVEERNNTGATCTTAGSYDLVTYCSVCKEVLKTEHHEGVVLPHMLTKTEAKAATCVAGGNIEYWTCGNCKKTFSDAEGKTEVTEVTTPVDANAHGATKLVGAKEATTTEAGYTGDKVCTLCDKTLEEGSVIPVVTGPMSKLLKGSDQDTALAGLSTGTAGWAASGTTYKMGGNDTVTDFFTVHYGAKSKVDTTEKTWDVEDAYYTTGAGVKESRFNFGATTKISSNLDYTIEFTTTKPATVKVWWVQGGGVDTKDSSKNTTIRNITLWDANKAVAGRSASTATDKNTAEFDTFALTAAGTYYLGNPDGSNYLFMIEVIEEGDIARTWAKPAGCAHQMTKTEAKPATCLEGGNIEYYTCSVCGKTFSDEAGETEVTKTAIDALGHDMTVTVSAKVPATCTENGKEAVKGCTRCDVTEGGAVIEATGHTEATRQVNVQDASCTVAGSYDEETYCTVCNEVLGSEHKDGVTLPHTLTKTEAVTATCSVEGNIAYWTCSVCDKTFSDAEGTTEVTEVSTGYDETKHGNTVLEGYEPATKYAPGYTGDWVCEDCGQTVTAGKEIPQLPENASKVLLGTDQDEVLDGIGSADAGWATDDDYYAMGTDDYFTVHYSAKAKVQTSGYKEWGTEGEENYYELSNGSTRFSFGGKGEINTKKDILRNLIEFTPTNNATVKIWYAQSGDTARALTIMNASGAEVVGVNAQGAKNEPVFATVNVTAGGPYYLGFVGGNGYFYKIEVIEDGDQAAAAPAKHVCAENTKLVAGKAATCTKAGSAEYYECRFCGNAYTDAAATTAFTGEKTIAALGHAMTKVISEKVDATCTEAGKEAVMGCTRCDVTEGGAEIAALGHAMTKVVSEKVDATCTEAGKEAVMGCARCDVTEGGAEIAALGHDMKEVAGSAKDATCIEAGKEADKACSRCDVTETGAEIPATGAHTEATRNEDEVAATCETAGSVKIVTYCSVCNTVIKTETVITDALGHDMQEVPGTAVAPTATEAGKEADKKCSRCDKTETGAVIPATGEEPTPVEVNKEALVKAISDAETAKGTATISSNGSDVYTSAKWVTSDEMLALEDAIKAAQSVNDKADATQDEVDEAVTTLNNAVAAFEDAKKNGTKSTILGGGGGGGGGRPSAGNTEDLGDTNVPLAGGPELNSADHIAYITGYTDGTVGAERNITRQETAVIFYRLLTEQSKAVYGTTENDFADVAADHWAVKEISTLAKAGIVKGLPDGSFGAEQNITRAEFVTMAARFYAVTSGNVSPFADVNGHWAEKEILFAYNKGWVNGLPDGSFGPDKLITRAEAMRIINNMLQRQVEAEGVVEGITQFSDVSTNDWYYYDVVEATNGHTYEREGKSLTEKWTALTK